MPDRGDGFAYLCCLEDPNSQKNKEWKSKLESDPFDYVCTAGAGKTMDYRGSIEEGTRNLAPANHHNKEFLAILSILLHLMAKQITMLHLLRHLNI